MHQMLTIDFHDDQLFVAARDDGEFVAITPICASIGIDAQKQRGRIETDSILREGVCRAVYPSAGGTQETFCLRLDLLNGWLFTINDKLVKDEPTRQKLLTYKRECYAVLARAFMGVHQSAETKPPHVARAAALREEPINVRRQVVAEARQTFGNQAAREVWFAAGLIITPAMCADAESPEFPFTYTAIKRETSPKAEAP